MPGTVLAVSRSGRHTFSKDVVPVVRLLAGFGAEGDAHGGATVQHRSRRARTPAAVNLRQVHLVAAELHEELRRIGFTVGPGAMGENVTTRGVDLLALPTRTRLQLGTDAVIELTGLRNPCVQLDAYAPGLMAAVLGRDEHGGLVRKAGVMAIVITDGEVGAGDPVQVVLPAPPYAKLRPV